MSYNAAPAFERGKTFYGPAVPDSADYAGINYEGAIRVFPNRDPSNPTVRRSGGDVTCMCVRNTSTISLLPKLLVSWATGFRGRRVDGYAITVSGEVAGVTDEFLPAGGVQAGDLFWITVKGQSLVKTNFTAVTGSGTFSEGSALIAVTGGASTSTTDAGRVGFILDAATITGSSAVAFIVNKVGRALTARTSANTNTDTLVRMELLY